MSLTSGAKLGPYEIQSPLGAGGMGEVYRARDTRLDRGVAIKLLPENFSSDSDRLQRFQHEARILSSLNHPNLLAIFDVGSQNGSQYLVSELLEGDTTATKLYVWDRTFPAHVFLVDMTSGERQPWTTLVPPDSAGVLYGNIVLTPDGKTSVYRYRRTVTTLFLAKGLQ